MSWQFLGGFVRSIAVSVTVLTAYICFLGTPLLVFAGDKVFRTHTAPDGNIITTQSDSGFVPAPSGITPSTSPYDSYTPEGLVALATIYSDEQNYSGVINATEHLRYRRGYCTDETMALEVQAAYHRGGQKKAMKHLTDIKKHKGENELMRHLAGRANQNSLDSFSLEGWKNYSKGITHFRNKNYSEAAPFLEKTVNLDENHVDAWICLAVANGKSFQGTEKEKKAIALKYLTPGYEKTESSRIKKYIDTFSR